MKRFLGIVFAISVLVIVAAFLVPLPIHREYRAVEIKLDDPAYRRECTIVMDGSYVLNRPFADDRFEGDLVVSLYPETAEADGLSALILGKEGSPLCYWRYVSDGPNPSRPDREEFILGSILSNVFLTDFVICIQGDNPSSESGWKDGGSWGGWNDRTGYCIVTNCDSYEEAVAKVWKLYYR